MCALYVCHVQAERADCVGGFLLLQSMAGGTGAGLGTYVARALRDEFPSACLTNCCVWCACGREEIVSSVPLGSSECV